MFLFLLNSDTRSRTTTTTTQGARTIGRTVQAEHRRTRKHQQRNTRGDDIRESSHVLHDGDHPSGLGTTRRGHHPKHKRS